MKLSACGLGLAFGLLWGFGCLIVGLVSISSGYGDGFIAAIGSIYPGYADTLVGSLLGLLWGFVDGFIAGFLIAWLYNKFACRNTPAAG